MSAFQVKLPDVGEGVAEAELIVLARRRRRHGHPGDRARRGDDRQGHRGDLVARSPASSPTCVANRATCWPSGASSSASRSTALRRTPAPAPARAATPAARGRDRQRIPAPVAEVPSTSRPIGSHAVAAPAVRARARALGIDIATVVGTGPEGRVAARRPRPPTGRRRSAPDWRRPTAPHTEVVRGLRQRIAERLQSSWSDIPHITYVEAVDATDLEALRAELNRAGTNQPGRSSATRLTILPFLARAMVIACAEQPRLNAHFDSASPRVVAVRRRAHRRRHPDPDGLMVPSCATPRRVASGTSPTEIARVSAAARDGRATPRGAHRLHDHDHVARRARRAGDHAAHQSARGGHRRGEQDGDASRVASWRWEPRQMFNLSSSFDHRMVDGWDAAHVRAAHQGAVGDARPALHRRAGLSPSPTVRRVR